jgi:hypothetical protein
MSKIKDLTAEEFTALLDGYFAPPIKRSQMKPDEIKELAGILNEEINVPIFNETQEGKIFYKIVLKVDTFLYDNLPNEFYDLVRSARNGIDDNEAKRLVRRLSQLANDKIDIPYIPEQFEYVAIRLIIGVIINAARKKWNFLKAKEKAQVMNIPKNKKVNNAELENMIVKYS